jgi:3-phosphoshikimate 1-carboxyvinyltransferase
MAKLKTLKPLKGNLRADSDKSITHRAFIIPALLGVKCTIFNPLISLHTLSTINALKEIGFLIKKTNSNIYEIIPQDIIPSKKINLWAGNSGTCFALLKAFIYSRKINASIQGDQTLMARNFREIDEIIKKIDSKTGSTLDIELESGSAQSKSVAMLAPFGKFNEVTIKHAKKSRKSTEEILAKLGVQIKKNPGETKVNYSNLNKKNKFSLNITSDPSSAAFIALAAVIIKDSEIKLNELPNDQLRIKYFKILKKMGANIQFEKSGPRLISIKIKSSDLKAIKIKKNWFNYLIDEYPILAVTCAYAEGISEIEFEDRLKNKESNRVNSICKMLDSAEVKYQVTEKSLIIYGKTQKSTSKAAYIFESCNDHRIVMASAIFSLGLPSSKSLIKDPELVYMSYPNFWEDLKKLGANFTIN